MTRVRRWGLGLAGTLALTLVGLLYAEPRLLVATAVPLAYVLYDAVSRVPADVDVSVTRSFDAPDPAPGDAVTVTLTIRNESEHVLPDVRAIDGVPPELAVTAGSPRTCRPISPGESVTLSYTVVAKRGEYRFDEPVVRLRSLAGSRVRTLAVEAAGEDELTCANPVSAPPLSGASLPRAGTLPTDTGGSGLEFYATRQYQAGDPMHRIDWRRYAKADEFVTVQYRQEQAIRTVLVVDARPVGRVTPRPGYPTGAELSAYAGERLYDALDRAGVVTSVTAVGLDDADLGELAGPDGLPWVDPDAGQYRAGKAEAVFDAVGEVAPGTERELSARAAAPAATDGGPDETIQRLLARLPPRAQVVCCTPLLDDWPVRLAESLAVRDYPMVLVSPDVTPDARLGSRVAGLHRDMRLRQLGRVGATTVSWALEEPIDFALRRSLPHLLRHR